MNKKIKLKNFQIYNDTNKLTLISGPCLLENERLAYKVASKLKSLSKKHKFNLIFKCSFDKANRSSHNSTRSKMSLSAAVDILKSIKKEFNIPITTDVHEKSQIDKVSELIDVIQIPAFLSRQTDLLLAAADTNKVINVKKGQFLSHQDVFNIIKKIESRNNNKIIITERGNSFGYNYLINDFKGISFMKRFGYPLIFDSTHSVQIPGGLGTKSGGAREFVLPLSKSAAALRLSGFFIETHPNPSKALSDGPNMVYLDKLETLIKSIIKINIAAKD
ncbi:MAG: 3-deoxy-8-phosphooctulonate synthase [Pelagibacteraceae bacterium]|nr:3-deoxy-8-phosphooctulonate synthase [Pelagibacteraceae bacterium]|tara:strand:+ start:2304 stop:3131 length:828 start_codon:yes stop_codon:yes gene_type:complete